MKMILSALVVALMLWTSMSVRATSDQQTNASKSTTQVCTLKVSGMTCAGCEAAVKMAARSVDGVKDVKASYAKKNAEVTYDPAKTTPEAIAQVITEKSGFKAEFVRESTKK